MAAIDLKDRKISTLEKQEKSKVAIAQALISNLGLLILQDPFTGLDRKEAQTLITVLREERDVGRSILVSIGNSNHSLLS